MQSPEVRVGLATLAGILILAQITGIGAPFWLDMTAAVGVLVPLGLKRLRCNPAVGTGVFITTINDFLGITILFVVAKVFYLPHLAAAP